MPRTSIKLAAAVLAAGLALAACGTVKMGAAAILSNQRISTTNLSDEVSDLSAGYQAYQHQIQLQYPVSQMPQQVLGWLVTRNCRRASSSASRIWRAFTLQAMATTTAATAAVPSASQAATAGWLAP